VKQHGIAVLRFDFTGLGRSEGEFANTTFSSNVDDPVAAADHLRQTLAAPSILIGHSLGRAAVLAAAHRVPEARAVVTINAPSDPGHVTGLLADGKAASGDEDKIEVTLGGRQFHVRRAFLDDIAHQNRARPKTKKERLSADLRVSRPRLTFRNGGAGHRLNPTVQIGSGARRPPTSTFQPTFFLDPKNISLPPRSEASSILDWFLFPRRRNRQASATTAA
jgi:pimeloyl-ACP methyl ester carboxylesterase